LQALIGFEKSQLTHRRLCESKSHASDSQIRTGRDKQLFFEVPMWEQPYHFPLADGGLSAAGRIGYGMNSLA
jgi:hypothetical protein